jgi:hypothetical protein
MIKRVFASKFTVDLLNFKVYSKARNHFFIAFFVFSLIGTNQEQKKAQE